MNGFVKVPESPSCRLSWSGVIEVLLLFGILFLNGKTPSFISCNSGFIKQFKFSISSQPSYATAFLIVSNPKQVQQVRLCLSSQLQMEDDT